MGWERDGLKSESVILMDLLDRFVFGPLNLIDRGFGVAQKIRHQDMGVRFKFIRGDKAITNDLAALSLNEIRQMYRHYRVATFDYAFDDLYFYFSVKSKQANWAEYLLLSYGAHDILVTQVNPRNCVTAAARQGMPKSWASKKQERKNRNSRAGRAGRYSPKSLGQ